MKKVVRKLNRVLSVLLTAAMVAGSVPEAGFTVNAAGLESETETEVQDLEVQEPDGQDADDSQGTGDAQDPGDQDTDDQNSGDDQSADNQSVSDDDQDDDSTPDNGNAEEDKESETSPAETSEPVSTEASDDNTAGKEDEVQADEGIEVHDPDPETNTVTVTVEGNGEDKKLVGVSVTSDSDGKNEIGSDATAEKENDYVFYVKLDKGYDLTDDGVQVFVLDTEIDGDNLANDETTKWTIKSAGITGDLRIVVNTEAIGYSVSGASDIEGATVNCSEKATVEDDYVFTVNPKDGYDIVKVTAVYDASASEGDGKKNIKVDVSASDSANEKEYVIKKTSIIKALEDFAKADGTGEAAFTIDVETYERQNVRLNAESPVNIEYVEGIDNLGRTVYGKDVQFTLKAKTAGMIPDAVTYTVGGGAATSLKADGGVYTISNATGQIKGAVEITATVKESDYGKKTASLSLGVESSDGSYASKSNVSVNVTGGSLKGSVPLNAENGWKLSDLEAGDYQVRVANVGNYVIESIEVTCDGEKVDTKTTTTGFNFTVEGHKNQNYKMTVTVKAGEVQENKVSVDEYSSSDVKLEIKEFGKADSTYAAAKDYKLVNGNKYVVRATAANKPADGATQTLTLSVNGRSVASSTTGVVTYTFNATGNVSLFADVYDNANSYKVTLNDTLSSKGLTVEVAGSPNRNADPTKLTYAELTKTGTDIPSGNYVFVRVKDIDGTISVGYGYEECADDGTYKYYKTGNRDEMAITVTAKVDVDITYDKSKISSVMFGKVESDGTANGYASLTELDYGAAYNVKVTLTNNKSVLKTLTVNRGAVTDISKLGQEYTAQSAIKADQTKARVSVRVVTEDATKVYLNIGSQASAKYAFNKGAFTKDDKGADKATALTTGLDFNGTLYFTLEGKEVLDDSSKERITKVEAITFWDDAKPEDMQAGTKAFVKESILLEPDDKGIYTVNVAKDTLIKVETETTYAVTVKADNIGTEKDIASVQWSDKSSGSWTTWGDENLIPYLAEGESVFVKLNLNGTEKEAQLTIDSIPTKPLPSDNSVFEVVGNGTMKIELTPSAGTVPHENVTVIFDSTSIGDVDTLKYKELPSGSPTTVDKETGDTAFKEITLKENTYYDFEVKLTADAAKTKYVSSFAGVTNLAEITETAAGTYTVRVYVTNTLTAPSLLTDEYLEATIKRAADDKANYTSVKYRVGSEGEFEDADFKTGTDTDAANEIATIGKIKNSDVLYVQVETAANKVLKSSVWTGFNEDKGTGSYKKTIIDNTTAITLVTDDSKNIIFAVDGDKKNVVEKVEYLKADKPDNWASALEKDKKIPNYDSAEKKQVVVADEVFEADDNIYFNPVAMENAEITAVKATADGTDIKIEERGKSDAYYTILAANIKDAKDITITIETKVTYAIAFDVDVTETDSSKALEVKTFVPEDDKTGAEATEITSTTELAIKEGDNFKFTITYDTNISKITEVAYYVTNDEDEEEPKDGIIDVQAGTPAADGTITNTYTVTPDEAGKVVIKGHKMATVTVSYNVDEADGTTITSAAELNEDGTLKNSATGKSYAGAKEDGTLYFTVNPGTDGYKVMDRGVTYETANVDEDDEHIWEELTADEKGVYTLSLNDVVGTQAIKIVTVRDSEKNNSVVFNVTNPDAVTIEYEKESTGTAYKYELGKPKSGKTVNREEAGNTVYTRGSSLDFKLTINPGYDVTGVTIGSGEGAEKNIDTLVRNGFGEFTAELEAVYADNAAKTVTVAIETKPRATAYETTIEFSKQDSAIKSYNVKNAGAKQSTADRWSIPAGTTDVEFTVVIDKRYAPLVSYDKAVYGLPEVYALSPMGDTTLPNGTPVEVSSTTVEYTYKVSAVAVSSGTIYLQAKEIEDAIVKYAANIAVNNVLDDVTVTVSSNDIADLKKYSQGETTVYSTRADITDEEELGKTIEVGKELRIYAYVPLNHLLESKGNLNFEYDSIVGKRVRYKAYVESINADINAELTPVQDNTVKFGRVISDASSKTEVLDENIVSVKGKYIVSKNQTFRAEITTGLDAGEFTSVTATAKNKKVVLTEDTDYFNDKEAGTATITVPAAAAGTEITFKVAYEGGSAEYVLSVAADIKDNGTKIKGNSKGVITQGLDTSMEYQLTGTTDFTAFGVNYEKGGAVDSAVIDPETGKLTVNTTTDKNESGVTLTIVNNADITTAEDGSVTPKTVATFTVKNMPQELKVKKVTPVVVLDNSAKLSFEADAKTVPTIGEKSVLAFQVAIKPESGSGAPEKVINTAFDATKVKAPTVKVTQDSIYEGSSGSVYLNISKNTEYDYMYVSVDAKDYQSEKAKESAGKANRVGCYHYLSMHFDVDGDGSGDISKQVDYAYPLWNRNGTQRFFTATDMTAGTYKYNVTFGTLNKDKEFVPQTKATSFKVTVKAAQAYKPTAKYMMDAKVGYVTLTGAPAEYEWSAYGRSYVELENANFDGKPNNFLTYFELDKANHRIKLKKDKDGKAYTEEALVALAKAKETKNDFTGYVTYYDVKTQTVKKSQITIGFKAYSYKATDIKSMADKTGKIEYGYTRITKDNKPVNVAYATAKAVNGGNFKVSATGYGWVDIEASGLTAGTKYKVELYIVEAGAYSADGQTLANNDAAVTNEGIGTKVAFTVEALNPKSGIVKVAKNASNLVFTADDYVTGGEKNEYVKYVSFDTMVSGAVVDTAKKVEFVDKDKVPGYFSVEYVGGALKFTVDKDALKAAEASRDPKKNKKSFYKATTSVKVEIPFANSEATEKIAFKLTAPDEAQTYKAARNIIENAEKTLTTSTYTNDDEDWEIIDDITAKAQAMISKDSGAVITVKEAEDAVTKKYRQKATADKDGFFNATIKVENKDAGVDTTAEENGKFQSVVWQWAVKTSKDDIKTLAKAAEAVGSALDYAGYTSNASIKDGIAQADVLSIVNKALTDGNADKKIEVVVTLKVNGKKVTEAKASDKGNVSVELTVKLSRSIWKSETFTRSLTITKYNNLNEAQSAIIAELGKTKATWTLGDEASGVVVLTQGVEAKTITDIADRVKYNPNITVAFSTKADEGFAKDPATGTATHVTGVLCLTDTTKTKNNEATVKLVTTANAANEVVVHIAPYTAQADAGNLIKLYIENPQNFTATTATSKKEVTDAAREAIHDPDGNLEITVKDDETGADGKVTTKHWDITASTLNNEGSIKATLVIKTKGSTGDGATQQVTIPINSLSTAAGAADAADEVLDKLRFVATIKASEILSAVTAKVGTGVKILNMSDVENQVSVTEDSKYIEFYLLFTDSTGRQVKKYCKEEIVSDSTTPPQTPENPTA